MNWNYIANVKRCTLLILTSLAAGLPTPSQSAVTAFDWTVIPSSFESSSTVPIGNGLLTVMRSGYTGGVYPVDVTGDAIPDGSLTTEAELETRVFFDGLTYTYSWRLTNLGSGAFTTFLGVNTPGFVMPLLGSAGLDRIAGTSDDLATAQFLTSSLVSNLPPGSQAWGIVLNPSTGLRANLLAPVAVPEPGTLALLGLGLAGLAATRRRKQ